MNEYDKVDEIYNALVKRVIIIAIVFACLFAYLMVTA